MPVNPLAEGLRPSQKMQHEPGFAPVAQVATRVAHNHSSASADFQFTQIGHLLLVTDAASAGEQIAAQLRRQSFRVWRASTVEGAQAILTYRVPDLMLLDITLPDSKTFFQNVRDTPRTTHLPVMLLTASQMDGMVKQDFALDEYDAIVECAEMQLIEAHVTSVLFFKSELLARALLTRFSQHLDHWQDVEQTIDRQEVCHASRGPPT